MNVIKRSFDIALALTGLVIGAPVFGLVALAVWIDSPGPVIFPQERIGRGGRRFFMLKFRKFPMKTKGGAPVTVAGDARMTRVGAFIERAKLDELPQLWNVLKGEMTLAGPRPESPAYEDLYTGEYKKLLDYVPGVFGPNQVHYRNESALYPPGEDPDKFYREQLFPAKARLDLEYFARSNPVSDLVWITRGLWVSAAGVVDWLKFMREHGLMVAGDILLCEAAWTLAHLARYGGVPERELSSYLWGLALFPVAVVGALLVTGLYRRIVSHFSLEDAVWLSKTVSVAWLLGVTALMGFLVRSSSVLVAFLGWAFAMNLLFLPRLYVRYRESLSNGVKTPVEKKVVIYGVNALGAALAHWVTMERGGFRMMGFLDDSSAMRNRMVAGYPAIGGIGDVKTVHSATGMDEIWLATEADPAKTEWLSGICRELGVAVVDFTKIYPFAGVGNGVGKDVETAYPATGSVGSRTALL